MLRSADELLIAEFVSTASHTTLAVGSRMYLLGVKIMVRYSWVFLSTLAIAVFLYGEQFTPGHAVAFSCIWLALALVSIEPFRRARRRLRA